jgi:glyoxylate/hydroxypyruvate reductase
MNIYIHTTLEKDLQSYLKNQLPAEFKLFFESEIDKGRLGEVFQDAEVIMGNPPPEWFDKIPKKLVFWQLDSAGFDQYSHLKLDIPVANMGAFFAQACAETIVGGVLVFYRRLDELINAKKDKKWVRNKIRMEADLLGTKEVIILGAGNIGRSVRQILSGFGCNIKIAARKNPVADFHSVEDVLPALDNIDLVINTLPGTAQNYVSFRFIEAMKRGSVYSSIGRGNTTDEGALLSALKSGKLAGAVLDVTVAEPLPDNHPFWEMENVILTQHTGGGKHGEPDGKVQEFLSNFNKFQNNVPIDNLIDLSKGY